MKMRKSIRILAYGLCLSLLGAGCGKGAEAVTGYGTELATAEKGTGTVEGRTDTEALNEKNTDTEPGNEKTSEKPGARKGRTLSDQLGGTELTCEDIFTIQSKAGRMKVKARILDYTNVAADKREEYEKEAMEGLAKGETLIYETETLPSYRVTQITEDKVHEQEVVKNILGDTATEVHRNISVKNGDAQEAVAAAQDTYNLYLLAENVDPEKDQPEEFTAWVDDPMYTLHTYEGKYNGIDTQLVINYRKDLLGKVITFGPKKWEDVVEEPGYNQYQATDDGKLLLPDRDKADTFEPQKIEEFFPELKNRAGADTDAMKTEASHFAENVLLLKLPEPAFKDERAFGRKVSEILSYPEGELEKANPTNVILDGYDLGTEYGIGHQSYYLELGDTSVIRQNSGAVSWTKKGIVAADFHIYYDFEEKLSDQVAILPFEKVMEALQVGIADQLDISKVPGSEATFEQACLAYYPMPSPEKDGEYTFIPVWVLSIWTNEYYFVGQVTLNAMDGSIIKIEYNE